VLGWIKETDLKLLILPEGWSCLLPLQLADLPLFKSDRHASKQGKALRISFFLMWFTSFHSYTQALWLIKKKCRLHCLCDVIPENFRSVVSLVPKYPATFKHFKRKSAMSVTWKKLSLLRSVSWVTKWYVLMYFFTSSLRAAFFWIGENYCRKITPLWQMNFFQKITCNSGCSITGRTSMKKLGGWIAIIRNDK
jgi:hypothetical protein